MMVKIAVLVLERLEKVEQKALSPLGPWPGVSAVGCCPNLRKDLPTVAQAQV
ncbi:hypothetical protein N9I09_02465 [Pontimonas sp.]|nr:hypothetical protein [Pontimonas sp.]MDA8909761.1 hypothetical protein [Pontimonas sp.]MDA9917993.1 hypothetical protein [Pontimonas sp.]